MAGCPVTQDLAGCLPAWRLCPLEPPPRERRNSPGGGLGVWISRWLPPLRSRLLHHPCGSPHIPLETGPDVEVGRSVHGFPTHARLVAGRGRGNNLPHRMALLPARASCRPFPRLHDSILASRPVG